MKEPKKIPKTEETTQGDDFEIDFTAPVKKSNKLLVWIIIISLISGCMAFFLYKVGHPNHDPKEPCGKIVTKNKNYRIDYNFFEKITRNQYQLNSTPEGKINRQCASKSNDVNLYFGDVFSMKTETILDENNNFSRDDEFHIFDCHQNFLYKVKRATNLEIYSAKGELIGIIKGDRFSKRIISQKTNTVVAALIKDRENETYWNIEIYEENHELADLGIVAIIFGKTVVLENDTCNALFNFFGIISVVMAILAFIFILFLGLSGVNKQNIKKKIK